VILQVLCEVGHTRWQAVKVCKKGEEPNKESSERQRLASLFFFHLSFVKETKVDFSVLFLRQLPHLSGIEQFYIDTFPYNNRANQIYCHWAETFTCLHQETLICNKNCRFSERKGWRSEQRRILANCGKEKFMMCTKIGVLNSHGSAPIWSLFF